ncbi:GAF domain-containing sensor histidine kinase [Oculatella sp. FACHB-28]|uniref:GAF domain-containing sensor histidine kinase n=1 Tax=Oculatella sp. FACHB-28 TaxID=2692845 RepID=UPI001687411C|nr:GAF domain-containing sensor histidine kinase [Oculatella sp. FACHB-28]MBD2059273.1 GAF domain-containing sensor histidine kinase [Oculatella sp. FACHB-28]
MRQKLAQILLTSDTSQSALLALSQVIGETFLADCCAITLNPDGASHQSVCWTPQSQATFHRYQPTSLIILQKRLFKGSEETSDCSHSIALADIQTALLDHQAASELQREPQSQPSSSHIPESQKNKPLLLNVPTPAIKAVLAKRTHFQGRINGVIMVMRSQSHRWTQEEVQLLETASEQVAIAISQTQLERQVQQQVRYQAFIDQLTRAIRSAWDLPQIFQLVTEGLITALQISRSAVLLLKYSDHPLKNRTLQIPKAKVTVVCESPRACDLLNSPTASSSEEIINSETGTWSNTSFELSSCQLCQQAFINGTEPVVISTATTDVLNPPISADFIAPAKSIAPIFNLEAMPALVLMPLESQGTVLGYLTLQHSQPCSWQREDIIFAKLVAAQLSTAIIQSRTLRQVQALVEERTAQLKRSLEVQAKLYEKTRQQVEQLRRLHQIREEFLSTVSHELRTPLTSMTLAIRMLRQADLPPERQARYLDILEQQCAQETSLINDLLALQKLESNSTTIQWQKIDFKDFIQDLTQSFEVSLTSKKLTLVINVPSQPLPVHTDLDSLNRILTELLTNAEKYADYGSSIHLNAHREFSHSENCLVLTLSNVGSAISPEELPYIFDKFRRGQGVTQRAIQGTGLGLALAKGLVEHLNGTIAVSSRPLEQSQSWETCFTLTLPVVHGNSTYSDLDRTLI